MHLPKLPLRERVPAEAVEGMLELGRDVRRSVEKREDSLLRDAEHFAVPEPASKINKINK